MHIKIPVNNSVFNQVILLSVRGLMMEESKTGWLTLLIVTLSVFIIVIDKTFLNVAISTLIRDLHTDIGTIQSIIAIYSLVMASLMIPGGKLQNVLGRRRTFLVGAFIYGVGTIIAATSINSTMLLVGWSILEGIGAALMMPATTSIISGSYAGERRAFALGIISSMASGAGTIGPIIGGFLTAYYSWRYAFGLELVVIIAIFLFSREIAVFPPTMNWSKFDVPGAIYSALGIFLIVMGILLLNNPQTWNLSPIFIVAGIVLLVIFYYNQKKKIKEDKSPLLDITLFKDRAFTLGNVSRLIMNFTIGGVLFVIPVFLQLVLGTDPLTTGLSLIPMSLGIFTLSFTAGKVSKRFSARYILSVGFLASMAGSIYLSLIFSPYTTILNMMPGILLLGIGMGIVFPHSANLIFSVARRDQQPDASGVMNTGINLGSSMGTAVLGVILILGSFSSLATGTGGFTPSYQVQLKDIPGKLGIGGHGALNEASVAPTPANLKKISTMKDAFNIVTIVLLIGLTSSIFIPPRKKAPQPGSGGVTTHI
jgi:EmrB/QacA subfamily drug resistance transporter